MLEFIITPDIKELGKVNLPDPDTLYFYNMLEDRIIYINYDIDESVVTHSYDIIRWNKEDKGIPIDERKPIQILINTDGGCLNSIMNVANTIKLSKTPVITIAMGKAFSAGFLLLLAGHKRYCFNSTEGLLHSGNFGIRNSTEKVMDYIDHTRKIEKKVKDYVTANSNITPEEYDKNYRNEWYMTSDELLNLGIVEKIIDDLDEII